ncbi:hypothetical protein [Paucibacter sp. XJ19-41]|uniref:hypothetical protein n=1 Tax=Paucibacter sp. XJ19-41 TaxID=2927824 RepID=UPI002349B340|nr:hypothetical protein [Paucibacter sp. XJ19-41]MDC6167874.1 hypothetical protein [Paucibacter sp. XJ19-41]
MTTAKNSQSDLLAALSQVADEPLGLDGFRRRAGSFTYMRKLNGSQQEVAFVADWNPKYQPGVAAHLHPMIRQKMPIISKRALELVKGDELLLARAPEVVLNQPIQFAAPKEVHVRWFSTGAKEFVETCESIVAFVRQWVLPLLSELSTPEGLVRAYESNDTRVMKQKHWHVFVVAAYIELGRLDLAREVVAEQFGSPGMRRQYSSLFDMVGDTM